MKESMRNEPAREQQIEARAAESVGRDSRKGDLDDFIFRDEEIKLCSER